MVIYSGDRWDTSVGDDRHRRGIYTFWRRTVPYPSMTAFDVPSREFCVSRRIRTNTPAAGVRDAERSGVCGVCGGGSPSECGARGEKGRRKGGKAERRKVRPRVDVLFRLVLGRRPSAAERVEMLRLVADQRARYAVEPQAAAKVVGRDEGRREGETEWGSVWKGRARKNWRSGRRGCRRARWF